MTITLEVTPEMEQELEDEASRRNQTLEELTKQALMRTLIEGLKERPIPQSLAELKPRRLPPPGKTAMEMVIGQWPGDETEEELLAALKAMG
jgi:hypothetical protein